MNPTLIFDVGFHLGEDTSFYLAKKYDVVAFEANPILASEGRKRFRKEIADGRLLIVDAALCGQNPHPPTVEFYISTTNSEWGTTNSTFRDRNLTSYRAPSRVVEVPLMSIESAFELYGVPLYVKMDIEGSDLDVLKGMRRLKSLPKYISIESEALSWPRLEDEMCTFLELGFSTFKIVQQRTIEGSVLRSSSIDGSPLYFKFPRCSSGPFGEDLIGEWLHFDEAINVHRLLFKTYEKWGPQSLLHKTLGRGAIAALQSLLRRPLPGWFDTHAKRG